MLLYAYFTFSFIIGLLIVYVIIYYTHPKYEHWNSFAMKFLTKFASFIYL